MGRFSHEALAVDPATGYVYETEDAGNTSGLYRFIPTARLRGSKERGTATTRRSTSCRPAAAAVPAGEWAGACHSPDGKWLFANLQSPGITFAITGPWASGAL